MSDAQRSEVLRWRDRSEGSLAPAAQGPPADREGPALQASNQAGETADQQRQSMLRCNLAREGEPTPPFPATA